MGAKHTPGPWHMLKARGCAFQIGDDADSNGATILATRFEWEGRADEMLANGRLMAAAPDLLAALQELADCGGEAWGEDRPCVKDARTAIAKATGSAA